MAVDMRALIERTHGPLPTRKERYRVGELISHCQTHAPALEPDVWEVALDHERRAMEVATLEPGALAAVVGARRGGFATAIWTNNARELTVPALARLGLADELDLVVTRDDMRALKPDPDGWRPRTGQARRNRGGTDRAGAPEPVTGTLVRPADASTARRRQAG